jgi:hypothetical protein
VLRLLALLVLALLVAQACLRITCQYWYFCASKASNLRTYADLDLLHASRLVVVQREYLTLHERGLSCVSVCAFVPGTKAQKLTQGTSDPARAWPGHLARWHKGLALLLALPLD